MTPCLPSCEFLTGPDRPRRTTNSKVNFPSQIIRPSACVSGSDELHTVVLLKKYGITVKFVTSDDPSELAAAIDEKTKAVFVETIGNPKYNVCPISEIAKVCDLYVHVPVSVLRWVAGCTRPQGPADRRQYVWHGWYGYLFSSRWNLPLMGAIGRVSNSSH